MVYEVCETSKPHLLNLSSQRMATFGRFLFAPLSIHTQYSRSIYVFTISLSPSFYKNFNLFSVCLFENENWNEFLTNCKNVSRPRIFIFFFFFTFPPSSLFFVFGGKRKKKPYWLAYLLANKFSQNNSYIHLSLL